MIGLISLKYFRGMPCPSKHDVEAALGVAIDVAVEMSDVPEDGCNRGENGTTQQIEERVRAYGQACVRLFGENNASNNARKITRVILAGSGSAPFMLCIGASFHFHKEVVADLFFVPS
jgi:hypothetical protein